MPIINSKYPPTYVTVNGKQDISDKSVAFSVLEYEISASSSEPTAPSYVGAEDMNGTDIGQENVISITNTYESSGKYAELRINNPSETPRFLIIVKPSYYSDSDGAVHAVTPFNLVISAKYGTTYYPVAYLTPDQWVTMTVLPGLNSMISEAAIIDPAVDALVVPPPPQNVPVIVKGAPITPVAPTGTYDTDKLTVTHVTAGTKYNGVTVNATVTVTASIASGANEIVLTGVTDAHPASAELPLVSVEITQASSESELLIENTAGVIAITLPADENDDPIDVTYPELLLALQAELEEGGALVDVVASIEGGASYDEEDDTAVTAEGPTSFASDSFTCTDASDGTSVDITLSYDGSFPDYDEIEELINSESSIVVASDGAESEAGPFSIELSFGVDGSVVSAGTLMFDGSVLYMIKTAGSTSVAATHDQIDLSLSETSIAALVGNTPAQEGSTISADLAAVYGDVETPDTGIKAVLGDKTMDDFGSKSVSEYLYDQIRNMQGVETKLMKVADGEDDIPETYSRKTFILPIVNPAESDDYAEVEVEYGGGSKFKIYSKVPGTAGNAHSINIKGSGVSQQSYSFSAVYAEGAVAITIYLKTDDDGEIIDDSINYAYSLYKEFLLDEVCTTHLVIDKLNEVDHGVLLDGTSGAVSFAGGTAALVPMTSSGEAIDAAVAAVGTYSGGLDLSQDVAALQGDIGTYTGGADISQDLAAAEGDIDDLEGIATEVGTPTMAVASTLTTGATDSELLWTAKTKGEDGDDLSVQFTVPQTSLVVTPTGGITAELKYTGVKGRHPISIAYGAGGADHTVSIGAVAGDITITVGSLCTADELYAAVMPSGVHATLTTLIYNIEKTANWGDGTTVVGTFAKDFLDSADETVTVTDGAIEVECAYDGATDLLTTIANDVITAIEAHTGVGEGFANNLVEVVATGAGTDVVEEMGSHSHLSGGVDGTAANAGKIYVNSTQVWIAAIGTSIANTDGWKVANLENQPRICATAGDHTVLSTDTMIVVTDATDDDADKIVLPAATGSLRRIIVCNQDGDYDIVATPDGSDTINGESTLTVGEGASITLIDYASGAWLTI